MPPLSIKIGDKFERLKVLRRVENDCRGRPRFECRCKCGNVLVVGSNALRTGNTRSCGCLKIESSTRNVSRHWKPPRIAALNNLFKSYREGAEKRELSFCLGLEGFKTLIQQPCHYCGTALGRQTHVKGVNGQFVYTGLDRIDNLRGYETNNTVACCIDCNRAKADLSVEQFIEWAQRVEEHTRSW